LITTSLWKSLVVQQPVTRTHRSSSSATKRPREQQYRRSARHSNNGFYSYLLHFWSRPRRFPEGQLSTRPRRLNLRFSIRQWVQEQDRCYLDRRVWTRIDQCAVACRQVGRARVSCGRPRHLSRWAVWFEHACEGVADRRCSQAMLFPSNRCT
jgi:hypothetical protein